MHRCNSLLSLWKTKVKIEKKKKITWKNSFAALRFIRQLSAMTPLFLLVCVANFLTAVPFCCLYKPFAAPRFLLHFPSCIDTSMPFSLFSYPFLILSWLSLNPSISISIQINSLFPISYFLLLCPSFYNLFL